MTERVPSILCHPDGKKSCGACCGMYNHVRSSEAYVRERLRDRTTAFRRDARIDDPESLAAFRAQWEDEAGQKLLRDLPSCPFLGYIDVDDAGCGPVGCMVHPLQNDGRDGRDCGIYDRFICEDYLCAAHDILRDREVRLVLDAVEDSYLYGLVITNPRFVRSLLQLLAARTGADPSKAVLRHPSVVKAAADCFELMRDWPYRGDDGIFGQVQVAGALETKRRRPPGEDLDIAPDPLDILLLCMGSECRNADELNEARIMIEDRLAALAAAVEECNAE